MALSLDDLQWRAGLYARLVGARIRSQMQYRISFALDTISGFCATFIDFLAILIIFAHLPRLAGWSLGEVAFFYGMANISFALADLVVGHLDLLSGMVRTGAFDLVLVRPVDALFQVLSSDFQLRRLGRVAQGVVVLLYALTATHIHWTAGRIVMLPLTILTGTVIYSAIWISATTVVFWTVEGREMSNAFTYGGSFLASYPVNIFSGWLRRILAFIIPMAFVCYFPGVYILNHPDPLHTPPILRFCAVPIALLLGLIAGRVWQIGVRHYRSTGS